MVQVIFKQKPCVMNGDQLLHAVVTQPEDLSQSAVGERKEYILELCEHIADCCYCEFPEYFLESDYPGFVTILQQRGLMATKDLLESYHLKLGEVFRVKRAIFKDDYMGGFCQQIDLRCSWHALLNSNSSKAYAQGLMDAEALTKLLEIR